ncbi:hypothetical protein FPQ18DRAFT_402708 [Pyronema domesticum]|nr:hypothetical protein FPQ18DRAFT_402708 [Pyronema domesticum]
MIESKSKRASTFNVISVTLMAGQTAASAKAARRSMFINLNHEADSDAALCQPEQDNDDVASLAPDHEDLKVVPAAPATATTPSIPDSALFSPSEMVEKIGATIRAVPVTTEE